MWHYFLVRSPFVRELLEYDDLPQSRQTQADTDSGSGTGAGPGETDKIKSS